MDFLIRVLPVDKSLIPFDISSLSNSVNLTDGLDGLASGCSSIAFFGLGTEILLKGQSELVIFSILSYAMSGLCLGFLKFNKHSKKKTLDLVF